MASAPFMLTDRLGQPLEPDADGVVTAYGKSAAWREARSRMAKAASRGGFAGTLPVIEVRPVLPGMSFRWYGYSRVSVIELPPMRNPGYNDD